MLSPGTLVGSYEIIALLGAGGMGEVYRARDSALGRDVALKILPNALAHDSDRLTRFRREAQVLASLNHPHIGAIYGLGGSQDAPALVLELVDGPTLAEFLARGPIPLGKALAVARQLVEALDFAHQQGVVHRDLKPANVKLRPDGTVKVLDFGLAKALDRTSSAAEASQSPTLAHPEMTGIGVVLGTPAYMSPEQALGDVVDKGTDIWAFGCVLFEMLVGSAVYTGESATAIRTAIIRNEPDWSRLPPETPESVRRALRRCLEKDRKGRLADIRDARLDIEDAASESTPVLPRQSASRRRERLLWAAALALVTTAAAATLLWRGRAPAPASTPTEIRVEITTPPTTDLVSFALSPDGTKVVFVASAERRPQLWLRSLESGSVRPLKGTEGASFPFWSPDSRSIGFFANEKLNRIDLDGGAPKAITSAPVAGGAAWSPDGVILFPLVPDAPLLRVSAAGGAATPLPGSDARDRTSSQRLPQFLPDGRHFLYYHAPSRAVFFGDLEGPERRRLVDADAAAVFAPPDQVLFVRQGTLFTQRFDPKALALSGDPSSLAESIAVDPVGAAAVSASAVGSIAYRTGSGNQMRRYVWFDRAGREVGLAGEPDATSPVNPALSPDGHRVAVNRRVNGNVDIWTLELGRDVFSRFTFDAVPEICPVWSPDGTRLLFSKPPTEAGPFALFQKLTIGAGTEQLVLEAPFPEVLIAMDWSRDGRFVLYRSGGLKTGWDIWALPMPSASQPLQVVRTEFDERTGQLSPDVRWIAYESNESGRYEIYMQPFPGMGAKSLVSNGGGSQPRWRSDGRELFYVAPDGQLMAVPVRLPSTGQQIGLGTPTPLFVTRIQSTVQGGSSYEYIVAPDGQRFLMATLIEKSGSPITLILKSSGR